jgi:hypothetical protein
LFLVAGMNEKEICMSQRKFLDSAGEIDRKVVYEE